MSYVSDLIDKPLYKLLIKVSKSLLDQESISFLYLNSHLTKDLNLLQLLMNFNNLISDKLKIKSFY